VEEMVETAMGHRAGVRDATLTCGSLYPKEPEDRPAR